MNVRGAAASGPERGGLGFFKRPSWSLIQSTPVGTSRPEERLKLMLAAQQEPRGAARSSLPSLRGHHTPH